MFYWVTLTRSFSTGTQRRTLKSACLYASWTNSHQRMYVRNMTFSTFCSLHFHFCFSLAKQPQSPRCMWPVSHSAHSLSDVSILCKNRLLLVLLIAMFKLSILGFSNKFLGFHLLIWRQSNMCRMYISEVLNWSHSCCFRRACDLFRTVACYAFSPWNMQIWWAFWGTTNSCAWSCLKA